MQKRPAGRGDLDEGDSKKLPGFATICKSYAETLCSLPWSASIGFPNAEESPEICSQGTDLLILNRIDGLQRRRFARFNQNEVPFRSEYLQQIFWGLLIVKLEAELKNPGDLQRHSPKSLDGFFWENTRKRL